jgi:antitoxin component YwqK of YwqJK toxin-antitoxin module
MQKRNKIYDVYYNNYTRSKEGIISRGTLHSRDFVMNGLREGISTNFFETAFLESTINYSKSRRSGECWVFNKNGVPAILMNYKDNSVISYDSWNKEGAKMP